MIRSLIIITTFATFSCRTQDEILMQKNLMSTTGEIVFIDKERGFVSIRWMCYDPPFRNQPCMKFMEFPIYLFNDPEIGKLIQLTEL
jgi:hypothetical protein